MHSAAGNTELAGGRHLGRICRQLYRRSLKVFESIGTGPKPCEQFAARNPIQRLHQSSGRSELAGNGKEAVAVRTGARRPSCFRRIFNRERIPRRGCRALRAIGEFLVGKGNGTREQNNDKRPVSFCRQVRPHWPGITQALGLRAGASALSFHRRPRAERRSQPCGSKRSEP
jgi:hypothetical protein